MPRSAVARPRLIAWLVGAHCLAVAIGEAAPPRIAPRHAAACRDGACAPHCPVRPQYFGYYPTTWRRWPGEAAAAAPAAPPAPAGAPRSVVPAPDEESPAAEGAAADAAAAGTPAPGAGPSQARVLPAAERALRGSPAEQTAFSRELVQSLLAEHDPQARAVIVETAALFDTPEARAICVGAVRDPDPVVRSTACAVWAGRGGAQAVQLLLPLAGADPDPTVRRRALVALGAAGESTAIDTLVASLDDPDPTVQQAAVTALRRISGEELGDDPARWRRWAARRDAESARWSWLWPWGGRF